MKLCVSSLVSMAPRPLPDSEVGNELSLTQSAVSGAVRRNEEIAKELGLSRLLTSETHNFMGVP
jgi:predicted transcriptional regulator